MVIITIIAIVIVIVIIMIMIIISLKEELSGHSGCGRHRRCGEGGGRACSRGEGGLSSSQSLLEGSEGLSKKLYLTPCNTHSNPSYPHVFLLAEPPSLSK